MMEHSSESAVLTAAEKRLRDWLMERPGGGEMWMIVKSGFRRSARDALAGAADMLDQNARGGTAYNAAARDVRVFSERMLAINCACAAGRGVRDCPRHHDDPSRLPANTCPACAAWVPCRQHRSRPEQS